MRRYLACLTALALLGGCALHAGPRGALPGTREEQRALVRVWVLSSPGGGMSWLRQALAAYEKRSPACSIYLRQASPGDLYEEGAVLPDLVLYMPGDLQEAGLFSPLGGEICVTEALKQCGAWRGEPYGLALCWAGYVLAISGEGRQADAQTPGPASLLASDSAWDAALPSGLPPGFAQEKGQLLCAGDTALFTLKRLLGEQEALRAEEYLTGNESDAYTRFCRGQCAYAVITTGQAVALEGRMASGDAPACRVMAADEIITDQVWLASLTRGAREEAAKLLSFLSGESAQRLLAAQGLQPSRAGLYLYASGTPYEVQRAGMRGLYAVNAYLPGERVRGAARRAFDGAEAMDDALLPLL